MLLNSIKNIITSAQSTSKRTFKIDENVILGALRTQKLELEDIEQLFKLIEAQGESTRFINVQVELYTNHKNYEKAFLCLLQSPVQRERVFDWIDEYLQLTEHQPTEKELLKKVIRFQMPQLVKMEVEMAAKREVLKLPENMVKGLDIISELQMQGYQATPCYQSLLIMASQFPSNSDWESLVFDELANAQEV